MTGSDDAFWFLDTLTIIRASGEVTDRRLALVEQTAPSGHAPPPHKHQREDEWFYVLDGELTFWLDGDRSVGGPGWLAFLPKGIPHGFAVTSSDPARFLIGTSRKIEAQHHAGECTENDEAELPHLVAH